MTDQFALVVDDFDVYFVGDENEMHLWDSFWIFYNVSVDWKEEKIIALTLDWEYE